MEPDNIPKNTGFLKETSGPGWKSLWFHIQLNSDQISVFLANPNKLLEIYFRLELKWKGVFLWILDHFGMLLFFFGRSLGAGTSLLCVCVCRLEETNDDLLGDVDFHRNVWVSRNFAVTGTPFDKKNVRGSKREWFGKLEVTTTPCWSLQKKRHTQTDIRTRWAPGPSFLNGVMGF